MNEERKKDSTRITDYFKRGIDYTYHQGVSEYIRVPITKTESKKVTNMVGTFLTDKRNSFQVFSTKTEPKKVANTVGTFLSEDSSAGMVFKCQSLKMDRKT